jgi:branched-subunit amino acid transport protein AzlD
MTHLKDSTVLLYTLAMSLVVFLCRAFVFLFAGGAGRGGAKGAAFLSFIEKAAPPVTMCVLAFNYAAARIKGTVAALNGAPPEVLIMSAAPVITASLCTAVLHIWKRNALLSIFAGLIVYMAWR